MTKDDIEEIRIRVESAGQVALVMTLRRDGTLGRQGSGVVPIEEGAILGKTDGRYFQEFMQLIDERAFAEAGVYDYPEKHGEPVTYAVDFLPSAPPDGEKRSVVGFRVSVGTEHEEVHAVVKYIDTLCVMAVTITNPWYQAALEGETGADLPGGV